MLALWEYFWTSGDWVQAAETARTGGGGGHKKKRRYESPDEEFWIVREGYLKQLAGVREVAEAASEIEQEIPAQEPIRRKYQQLVVKIRDAETLKQLYDLNQEVEALLRRLKEAEQQYEEDAIVLMLFDF